MIKQWIRTGLVLLISLLGLLVTTQASANTVGFTVAPQLPKNQVDQSVPYFDLKLDPKQEQTVGVVVKNTSGHAITVHVSQVRATTNINGAVEYKPLEENKSINLPADFADLVTTKQPTLKLKKGENRLVNFKIKMPAKQYPGVVVGGLTFLKKTDQTQTKQEAAVKNQYSYTVATVLHGSHDLKKNHLTLGTVKGSQQNGYNEITLALQNRTAAFLNKVQTNVKIYHRGGHKVLYQEKKQNGQMAPNSVYQLPLKVGNEALKPGKYTAKLTVDSKKQHWEFTKNFVITGKQAQKLNQNAVIDHQVNWWLWIGIGLLILLLLLLLAWYIYRKQRKIKALERELEEQKQQ